MNYRKFYSNHHNIELPPDIDVHHLDHNKDNNKINNLVHLPSKLHLRYHAAFNKYLLAIEVILKEGFVTKVIYPIHLDHTIDYITNYHEVYTEVRLYLLKTNQIPIIDEL